MNDKHIAALARKLVAYRNKLRALKNERKALFAQCENRPAGKAPCGVRYHNGIEKGERCCPCDEAWAMWVAIATESERVGGAMTALIMAIKREQQP